MHIEKRFEFGFVKRHALTLFTLLILLAPAMVLAAESPGELPALNERMMLLVIQVGLIIFAARCGGWLFEKFHLPGVLGELCIGILIGPHLLGGIPIPWLSGFEQGLFHDAALLGSGSTPVSPELYGICSIASIVLLFVAGLETDLKLLFRYALAGGLVGLGGVIFSYLVGAGMGMWLLPALMNTKSIGFFHPAAIFLGVMSTATSVSITARILSERKKMDTPEGVTILAGAVIDDVLGIVILAIGIGVISASGEGQGVNWGHIGMIAFKSFGIWLGATILGIRFARRIGWVLKSAGAKAHLNPLSCP